MGPAPHESATTVFLRQRSASRPGNVTRNQIEFVGLVVDHLTAQGVMDPGLLHESPFTNVAPRGPEQIFDDVTTDRLFAVIEELNRSAVRKCRQCPHQTSALKFSAL